MTRDPELKATRVPLSPDGDSIAGTEDELSDGLVRDRYPFGSFEAAGFAASSEAELRRALDAATASDRVSLIDARIARSNYAATLAAVRG